MKAFVVLAFCAASVAANGGGWSAPAIRLVETPSYAAPAIRLVESSYAAPAVIRADSYDSGYGEIRSANLIPITNYDNEIRGSESNTLRFDTGNGISVVDNTHVHPGRGAVYDDGYGNMVQSNVVLVKEGHFSYTSPEGLHISTGWAADDMGFRADGAHLPVPVAMPVEHAEAHRQAILTSGSSYSHAPLLVRSSY